MMDPYLEQVKQIVLEELEDYQVRVYLFGSRARGETRSGSDCDIAVESVGSHLPLGLLSRIRERLEESRVPYEVELVDLDEAPEDFARRVRQEGVLWSDTRNE